MKNTLLLLIFISAIVSANPEATYKKNLLQNFYRSLDTVSEQEKKCADSTFVLPKNTFGELKLSQDAAYTVINYFYLKNKIACVKSSHHDYYAASTLLRLTDSSKSTQEYIAASDELISYSYKNFVKAGIEYSALSEKLRKEVEGIQILKKGFLPLESMENISP